LPNLILRHPVLSVFLLALTVRALLSVVISVAFGGVLFQDDGTYPVLAMQRATGQTQSWSEYEYFLFNATATLLLPLTWIYQVFGFSVLAGQLLVGLHSALAAAATTRLALEALPARFALLAGVVVAMLPSQVLFSSTVLKDPAVWACLAGVGLVLALLGRAKGWRAAGLLVALSVLFLLLAHLRLHTLVAAGWAAVLAIVLILGRRRLTSSLGVLVLALLVPLYAGVGIGGYNLIVEGRSLGERRLANAAGATTSFVAPLPSGPSRSPASSSGDLSEAPPETPGEAEPAPSKQETAGGRTLPALTRGLSVMVLEPYPVPSTFRNSRLLAALAENVLWWPLLALALLGSPDAWRHRRVLAFPILAGGAIVLLYALAEGNFGTAYRHRGEVVWVVALLAAVGVHRLLHRSPGHPA